MQRQSVPLLYSEAPLVGTGLEGQTARDSGMTILSLNCGKVINIDSDSVQSGSIIEMTGKNIDTGKALHIQMNNNKLSSSVFTFHVNCSNLPHWKTPFSKANSLIVLDDE